MIRRIVCFVLFALLLTFSGCNPISTQPEQTPEHILRLSANVTEDSPAAEGINLFVQFVEERSGGRISIEPYYDNVLGEESSVLEQLRYGGIDIGLISHIELAELYEELLVFSLPYLFDSKEQYFRMLDNGLLADVYSELEEDSLKALAWYDMGSMIFCSDKWSLNKPDNYFQLTVGVTGGSTVLDAVTKFGANVLALKESSLGVAFNQHLISVGEETLLTYVQQHHFENAPYLLVDYHAFNSALMLIGMQVTERLPAQDIEMIRDCACDAALYGREHMEQTENHAIELLHSEDCIITVATKKERAIFRETLIPVYTKYTLVYRSLYDKIVAMQHLKR